MMQGPSPWRPVNGPVARPPSGRVSWPKLEDEVKEAKAEKVVQGTGKRKENTAQLRRVILGGDRAQALRLARQFHAGSYM